MKNFLLFIVFLTAAVFLVMMFSERVQEYLSEKEETEKRLIIQKEQPIDQNRRSFPATVNLISQNGRELNVRLIARTKSHVQFERVSDNKTYVYPIEDLQMSSAKLVTEFKETGLKDPAALYRSGAIDFDENYREQLRTSIKLAKAKITSLRAERRISSSIADKRRIDSEIAELKKEMMELMEELSQRSES